MSFLYFLETIQQKPARTRKKILIVSTLCIMVIIVAAWITFPDLNKERTRAQTAEPLEEMWERLQGLKDELPQL